MVSTLVYYLLRQIISDSDKKFDKITVGGETNKLHRINSNKNEQKKKNVDLFGSVSRTRTSLPAQCILISRCGLSKFLIPKWFSPQTQHKSFFFSFTKYEHSIY